MMKIALQVHGQEMTFSEEELTAIVEEHFSNEPTERVSTENVVQVPREEVQVPREVAQVPTEDKLFEVNPQAIDQRLFQKEREDPQQENTRQSILEAFVELKDNPRKYARKFYTKMPKRTWDLKTVLELKRIARESGHHNADWVEKALEWAQRICNGESWEAVCNDPDTANWYRLVAWKNGYSRVVGGSRNLNNDSSPASSVSSNIYGPNDILNNTVPLIVLYEE